MDADRTERVKPDYGTMICVFVVIFWPLSLLLGIADHWFIYDYDLRLMNHTVAYPGVVEALGVALHRGPLAVLTNKPLGPTIGILESLVNLWQAQWREVAVFALVILVLAFRPTGLFGKKMVEKV